MSILNGFPLSPYTFTLLMQRASDCFGAARPIKDLSKGLILKKSVLNLMGFWRLPSSATDFPFLKCFQVPRSHTHLRLFERY